MNGNRANFAAIAVAAALLVGATTPGAAHDAAPATLPFQPDGAFSLVDHTGTERTNADFAGRYLLIYFGYSTCPHTCGTALVNMSGALDRLGDAARRLVPLFITVDPEHDTPERLAAYLANFHPSFVGLTGAPAQVRRVLDDYRIEAKAAADAGAFERRVDHTPFTYLVAPDGALLTLLPPIVPPPRMAEIIASYLR